MFSRVVYKETHPKKPPTPSMHSPCRGKRVVLGTISPQKKSTPPDASPQKKKGPWKDDLVMELALDLDEWEVEFGSAWAGWPHAERVAEHGAAVDAGGARSALCAKRCEFWLAKIELASCCVAYLDKVCEHGDAVAVPAAAATAANVFEAVHAFDPSIMPWALSTDAKADMLRRQIRIEWQITMHNADLQRLQALVLGAGGWPAHVAREGLRAAVRLDLAEAHVGLLEAEFGRMTARLHGLMARAEVQRRAHPAHVAELARLNLQVLCPTPRTSRYEAETLVPLQDAARVAAQRVEEALP